jgi:hypothetical protein
MPHKKMPMLMQAGLRAMPIPAGSGAGDLVVDIAGSFESLPLTAAEWDAFMEGMDAEIFLSHDWCRLWWKYYGAGNLLRIFTFRSKGRLAGILPLYIEKIPPGIRTARIVSSHYMPTAVRVTIERGILDEAIEAVSRDLFDQCAVDLIHFGPLSAVCGNFVPLLESCRKSAPQPSQIAAYCYDVQTCFHLKETWDAQMDLLSHQERKRMRRAYKDLESADLVLTVSGADEQSFREVFSAFVAMHQQRWNNAARAGHFVDWPRARDFHEENAAVQLRQGRLRLLEMKINNQPIGYKFAFRFGRGMCAYLDARAETALPRHLRFSHLAFCEQVRRAIAEGVRWVDSLCGFYPHKLALGGVTAPMMSILFIRKGAVNSARVKALRTLAFLNDGFYSKLYRNRLVPRLRLKTGPLQHWWLQTSTLIPVSRLARAATRAKPAPEPGADHEASASPTG